MSYGILHMVNHGIYREENKVVDIERILKNMIIDIGKTEKKVNEITGESSLTIDFGYDSIKLVELIVEIENEFCIELEDEDLNIENISVYRCLLDMVTDKIVNKK